MLIIITVEQIDMFLYAWMVMDEKREGDNEWRKRSYMIVRLYKHIAI